MVALPQVAAPVEIVEADDRQVARDGEAVALRLAHRPAYDLPSIGRGNACCRRTAITRHPMADLSLLALVANPLEPAPSVESFKCRSRSVFGATAVLYRFGSELSFCLYQF